MSGKNSSKSCRVRAGKTRSESLYTYFGWFDGSAYFSVQYGTIYVDLDFQMKPISTSMRTQNLYLSIAHLMSVHPFVVSE